MRIFPLLTLAVLGFVVTPAAQAGLKFGIQGGLYSPTKGLDDHDNGIALGVDLQYRILNFGLRLEGFYVDSTFDFIDELGDGSGVDLESIFAADFVYYPAGMLVFLQAGLNVIDLQDKGFDQDVIDNQLGYEVGVGVTFFDKLMVQGKYMFTPSAFEDGLGDVLNIGDQDVQGFLVTVGWHF